MAFLPEFLNNNAHRYYPFDPIGNNPVPPALILDMGIIATSELPDNSGENTTYISKIVTDGIHVRFYMSAKIGGNVIDFGCVATADADTSRAADDPSAFQRVPIGPVRHSESNIVFEGFMIIGDLSVLQKMPPTFDDSNGLDEQTGRIYTGCIQHMTQWVAGLRVGSQILGGIVTIAAGAGVNVATAEGNIIFISCTGAIPPGNDVLVDDQTLLAELELQYGVPITSINGVPVNGDWQIVTVDKEGLTIQVNADTHSITLNNTLASACCNQDDIQYIVDNVAALNERVGIISTFQTQLDTNLNIVSTQMSKLL